MILLGLSGLPSLLLSVLLGRGERIFDGSADPSLEVVEVAASPYATHIRYRVGG